MLNLGEFEALARVTAVTWLQYIPIEFGRFESDERLCYELID